MQTTTSDEEMAACLERGHWYELVDPGTGDFWGRWLHARDAEPFRQVYQARTGVALQVCFAERLSPAGQLPLRVRVSNIENPRWRRPR